MLLLLGVCCCSAAAPVDTAVSASAARVLQEYNVLSSIYFESHESWQRGITERCSVARPARRRVWTGEGDVASYAMRPGRCTGRRLPSVSDVHAAAFLCLLKVAWRLAACRVPEPDP